MSLKGDPMPVLAPYVPVKDAALNSWLANFSTLATASPSTYGLVAGDAVAIAAVVAAWAAAYALVTSPSTKTASTVAAKNAEKVIVLATVRPYAQAISLNAGVSSANKSAIGVNPRTSVPLPITAPTTYPGLTVVSQFPLNTILRYRDSMASPSVKSKPYGVIGCQIFAMTSATVITNPALLTFALVSPKSPLTLPWQSSDAGKIGYIAARWVTRKGLVGPWSPIVSGIVTQ
jgi:hypothetical protein